MASVASEGSEEAQPCCCSPAYYLERALTPFAEVKRAHTANLEHATADPAAAAPSIIILSDVGRLAGHARERLKAFVENGWDAHPLCRPRLRTGRRFSLSARSVARGGTVARRHDDEWTSPQKPAPFELHLPFNGLTIPADVTVAQQVLSDPSAMPRDAKVWCVLGDGTPLL